MATPIKTRKLSHLFLNVSDMDKSIRFYTEILGFKVSDRNQNGMVFLRNATDHHSLGLAPGPAGATQAPKDRYLTFHHVALEVESVHDLFEARDFLQKQGIELEFEGRRGAGCNVSLEIRDPDGYPVELTCQMDQVGWDGVTRPADQYRPAKSLEEAIANLPGS